MCREIRHEVRKGPWIGFEPSIIFPALKLASEGFSNLETITIQQYRYDHGKGPSPLGTLPATLRQFTLELVVPVEETFFDVDYASIYPKLLTLRLCSFYGPTSRDSDSENQSSWVYRLPKSLTILGLQNVVNDNIKFAEYLCGLDSYEATSSNDVDATSWPLPNLQYLELGQRASRGTNTYPSISKYPPSLKYLRICSKGCHPLQMHLPPSSEGLVFDMTSPSYYLASPASPTASSSNALESAIELVPEGTHLRYYATDTTTMPDVLPTLHLTVDSLSNLSSLPVSLTSFTGHIQTLNMSMISLLPRRLRYLTFDVWEDRQLWPENMFPNLTSLCVTEFWDTGKKALLEANTVFPALPKTLRRLEVGSPGIFDAETMARLPPSLTMLSIGVDHADGKKSAAIPRGITHLRVSTIESMEEYPRPADFEETFFSLLPPNLLQLHVVTFSEVPALALAHLPRSLRALHLNLIKLPAMPKSLAGISGSVSSWLNHAFTGTDSKDGHRTRDWIDHCLTLLPPGCLCTANFCRDGDRIFGSSSASLTHLRIDGMKSTICRFTDTRVEDFL
jgi:hypothetical protein